MATNNNPIWKDYYVSFNTEDSPVNYSIYLDGEAIFYGKAYCPPSHSKETYTTKINHICENYLSNNLTGFESISRNGTTIKHTNASRTFEIVNEDKNTTIDEVTFVYDWSYDSSVDYNELGLMNKPLVHLGKPINGRGKDGMYFFRTSLADTTVQTTAAKIPTVGYSLVEDCNSKWALYYLNRYGGWDSYLIEGYVSKKDNFKRYNVNKQYDNNSTQFGTTPYLTETSTSYEIHTGWMNERESEIMASNVFQSTRLFLHNLETDKVIPVIMTDADVLYKNHKNSGRKLLNYTINVMASQTEHNKN